MTAPWLPRTRDVTAMVLGAMVAADALVTRIQDHHPVSAWSGFAGALVGAAALWWRRPRPVAVTVLGLVLCTTVQIEWPLAVGLTTLAIRRRDRPTWLLSGAAVFAVAGESLLATTHGHLGLVGTLTLAVPWVALFTCTGAFLGLRRASIADLKDRAERAEAEQEIRAEQSRLNERTRIATEMHDVLAHRISLIALHAGGLEVTENPTPESVRQTAGLIRETAHTALEDLRGILGVLKSPDGRLRAELAPQPRFADLEGLIRASAEAGIPITLSGGVGFDADVPEPLGRAVYRVVQESLTNIHKHAAGAETLIRLAGTRGRQLEVCVENLAPLVPAPSLPGSGSGLIGLRERVSVAGGTLDARPLRGGGFRVRARLPWPVDPGLVGLGGEGAGDGPGNGPLGDVLLGDVTLSQMVRSGSGRNSMVRDVVPGQKAGRDHLDRGPEPAPASNPLPDSLGPDPRDSLDHVADPVPGFRLLTAVGPAGDPR